MEILVFFLAIIIYSIRGIYCLKKKSSIADPLSAKPRLLSAVVAWGGGGGLTLPTRLPLPSADTQVVQVAAGRTQRAAVTKHGRLFVWEVRSKKSDCGLYLA